MSPQPTVKQYMTASPHSVGLKATLAQAKTMMETHHIRHLPVLDAGKLVGIVSDRDVQLIESLNSEAASLPVEEAMSQVPYTVRAETPLREAAAHMAEHKLGSTVVVDAKGKVTGVFTTVDGLRALAELLS